MKKRWSLEGLVLAIKAMDGKDCCTRTISSPASTAPSPSPSTKTIQPSLQDPPAPRQLVPLADRHTETCADRFTASERAYRRSVTSASAAACTVRFTRNVRKLGIPIDARIATRATTISSSISVKPVWRIFMVASVAGNSRLLGFWPTTGLLLPPDGTLPWRAVIPR